MQGGTSSAVSTAAPARPACSTEMLVPPVGVLQAPRGDQDGALDPLGACSAGVEITGVLSPRPELHVPDLIRL